MGDAAFAQVVLATFHAAGDVLFDGFLRDAEAGSDLLLRDTLEFAKHGDFTAAGRQRRERLDQQQERLVPGGGLGGVVLFRYDSQRGQIPYNNLSRKTLPA